MRPHGRVGWLKCPSYAAPVEPAIFGYFPLFRKTASPSPVMFWTVKAPFWYALVAPRPEETAHPLRSRQPVPGKLGGTPPLDTSAARTRNARDQRCALASPLPPSPFAPAPRAIWAALSPPPPSPLPLFFFVGVGVGRADSNEETPQSPPQ